MTAALLRKLTAETRRQWLATLTPHEAQAVLYRWPLHARPEQLAPAGNWSTWLIVAGRGFGKTRTGAEWVREQVDAGARRIALVGRTASDVRDVMVEGESGLLAVCPPWNKPIYEPSKRRLTWPNGAIATTYTADKPDQLRGPQHEAAWCDELAAWRYMDTWDQLQFGLRLGTRPRAVVTTTPRPLPVIREMLQDPSVAVTRGKTYDNFANLAPRFIEKMRAKYEGTRLGRQELNAEILDDTPGALWRLSDIERLRVRTSPPLKRVVIAVDPPGSTAECGIVAAGLGYDNHGYVLDDGSLEGTPALWGAAVITMYRLFNADRIVGEVNQGGEMVEHVIRTVRDDAGEPIGLNVPYRAVHASRGKATRAEPISALYEQGRIHHVGAHADLETQMTTWVPGDADSPDRMDALVWALTELFFEPDEPEGGIVVEDQMEEISRF